MARFLYSDLSNFLRKWGFRILAFSWFLGLLLGKQLYSDCGPLSSSLMHLSFQTQLSIVGLVISVFLPLLFSAFAVYISQPILLVFICFCKAVCLSFISCWFCDVYGNGAWIFRLLVLFHNFAANLLLLLFSFQHISGQRKLSFVEFAFYFIAGFCAVAVELFFLFPIMADLNMM